MEKKKAKRGRPKQERLPGEEFQVEKHPDVATAAEAYADVRDKRMKLTEKEIDARSNVVDLMKKHKLTKWRDPDSDLIVELEEQDAKLKVKRAKEPEAEE